MTRAEMMRRMSHKEFIGWYALYTLEHRERQDAQDKAEGQAKAQRLARGLGRF